MNDKEVLEDLMNRYTFYVDGHLIDKDSIDISNDTIHLSTVNLQNEISALENFANSIYE